VGGSDFAWFVVILQAFDTNSTSSIPNADEESENKRNGTAGEHHDGAGVPDLRAVK
jgi:hypothetical protein